MARLTPRQPKTADQITANWIAGMQGGPAQAKYKAGIAAFQGNPMALAASDQATQKYLRNVQQSVSSGKRAANLNAADPAVWKANAINIGAANLGQGAVKKRAKYNGKMQKMAGVYAQASQAAAAVADDGGMNLGKIQAAIQVMRAAAGKT
jgi:hypothetical protein